MNVLLALTLFLGTSPEPVGAGEAARCGQGVIVDFQVRDDQALARFQHRKQTAAVYTLVVRFAAVRYTAEANNGRIGLFGPLLANVPIDVCIRDRVLILTQPRDLQPEITTYEMKVVKQVLDTGSDHSLNP